MQDKTHNQRISIAKGVGILLMVIGHSGCPEYLHSVIYSFHMVLFYFLSGFFFRDGKVICDGRKYLMRKFRRLYWPYIKWSIIFILLHNFFYEIGFNETLLSDHEIWINVKRSFRGMWQGERFLGAYWFLISLFWVIIIFSFIIWLSNCLKIKKFVPIIVLTLFCVGVAFIESKIDIWLKRELMVLPFFYMGYLVGNGHFASLFYCKYHNIIAYLVCFPILLFVSVFVQLGVAVNNYGPYYIYLVTSLCGIYLTMIISHQLEGTRIGLLFDRWGEKTMQIMTLHFFAFKIMTFVLVWILCLPHTFIQEWPVPIEMNYLWFLYTIAGIFIPIYLFMLFYQLKRVLLSSIK